MAQQRDGQFDFNFRASREEVRAGLESIGAVPSLSVVLAAVAGEYWTTHPGPLNVRWWWLQLETDMSDLRDRLIDAWTLYVDHESYNRTLEGILSPKDQEPANATPHELLSAMREHQGSTVREIAGFLDSAAGLLFSIRERVAWLAYEMGRLGGNMAYVPPGRIGYHVVRQETDRLRRAEASPNSNALLDAIALLESPAFAEVVGYRNGNTHRLRVRAHEDPPPLFLEIKKGCWDSVQMGRLEMRRVLHLVDQSYHQVVKCLQRLASIQTNPQIFTVGIVLTPEPYRAPFSELHHGVLLKTRFGDLRLKCMKQCHGFIGKIEFDPAIDPTDDKFRNELSDAMSDAILATLPPWESERAKGTFAFVFDTEGIGCITLLTNEKESRRTIAADVGGRVVDEIRDGLKEGATLRWANEEEVVAGDLAALFQRTYDWPSEALPKLLSLMKTDTPSREMLVRTREGGELIIHVAMNAQLPAEMTELLPEDHPGDEREGPRSTVVFKWVGQAVSVSTNAGVSPSKGGANREPAEGAKPEERFQGR